jgi:hypothetical protein
MKFPLYTHAALNVDVPRHGLRRGDVVTLVDFLEARNELPNAYVCEVFNAVGETIAVITVQEPDLVALTEHEILHTRPLVAA